MVDALERGGVDHPGRVADEHSAGHRQLGHRPVAATRKRLCAPGDPLAAVEDVLDQRMRLECLQEVVRRGRRVAIVEVDHEPDRNEVVTGLLVLHRVYPGAAELPVLGRHLQRPRLHERVDHPVERLLDLPELLDPELPYLRLAVLGQPELLDRRPGEVAPAALGQHRHPGGDVGAGLEVPQRLAVLAAALVARADPDDPPVIDQQLGGAGLGQDVGAAVLRLPLLIAGERGDRRPPRCRGS